MTALVKPSRARDRTGAVSPNRLAFRQSTARMDKPASKPNARKPWSKAPDAAASPQKRTTRSQRTGKESWCRLAIAEESESLLARLALEISSHRDPPRVEEIPDVHRHGRRRQEDGE